MKKFLFTFVGLTMMISHIVSAAETELYSDDFNRTELSDASHAYTMTGNGAINANMLRLTCPKDGSSAYNSVVGNYNMRANLSSFEADSLVWTINLRQNYGANTAVLSGFDNNKRAVAFVLVASSNDWTTANGYALTYGGTGKQEFCLSSFTGGLTAQQHIKPFLRSQATTDGNKKYYSFRIVYTKSNSTWKLYQYSEDNAFAETVGQWGYCGSAQDATYTSVALKYFGWWQNYTGTTDFVFFADNLRFSYFPIGEQPSGDEPVIVPDSLPTTLDIKSNYNGGWSRLPLTLIGNIADFDTVANPRDTWTRNGSYRFLRTDSTGFYYVKKIDGRWWLIDPDGYVTINRAVCTVPSTNIQVDYDMMTHNGYNSTGNFLGSESQTQNVYNSQNYNQWGYTRRVTFFAKYKTVRHKYYPNTPEDIRGSADYVFALDPLFPHFCDSLAYASMRSYVNDRNMVGWFTDNEIPFQVEMLQYFVKNLPATDSCRIKTLEWAATKGITENDILNSTKAVTNDIQQQFAGYVAEAYYKAVHDAIRKVDSHHLILGSRLHGRPRGNMYVVKASHQWTDVTSVNFYDKYQPNDQIAKAEWTLDHPCIVGEMYVKDINNQSKIQSGAGWYVKNQTDRGFWNQHCCLQLLANKCYVGWHYFRYMDDDDGSNKGLVNHDDMEYKDMTRWIRQLNDQVYALCDYYDGQHRDVCSATLGKAVVEPQADTYIHVGGTEVHGTETTIQVQYTRAENDRKEAFVRFAIPQELTQYKVRHAELVLTATAAKGIPQLMITGLTDTQFDEKTMVGATRTANANWKGVYNRVATYDDEMKATTYHWDITTYIRENPATIYAFKLHALKDPGSAIVFGARENEDAGLRPQLVLTLEDYIPSALRETKTNATQAKKKLTNGQLRIEKNNKTYSILGNPL